MKNKALAGSLLALGLCAGLGMTARADDASQSFHEGCMRSVTSGFEQKGVQIDNNIRQMASNYCDCAQREIAAKYTPAELQAMQQPNADPALFARMEPIKQQCSKENFHQ